MAISYPISPGFEAHVNSFTIQPIQAVAASISPFTFSQQVYSYAGKMWKGSIVFRPMKRAEAAEVMASIVSLNGMEGKFYFGDPAWSTPQGVASGTPLINGASQTGYEIDTDGWTISTTDILKAGDFIQIGSGSSQRLHQVMVDADSDGSGQATLTVWPDVRSAFADNTSIITVSPKAIWRLASMPTFIRTIGGITEGLQIDIAEAL